MKRQRLFAVAMAVFAIVALMPTAAQNTARHAFDLDDILSFRAIGQTAFSNDGQWFSYRMSPLQGDSDVLLRQTSSQGKEMKFAVGEGAGGAVTFSEDSKFAALTIAPTRREAQANTRARRP